MRDISLSRTVLEVVLRLIFSPTTSALSALEVFHYNALCKFMFAITITITIRPAEIYIRCIRYHAKYLSYRIKSEYNLLNQNRRYVPQFLVTLLRIAKK